MKTSTATNIKIELLRSGVTQSEIARSLGMSVGSVNDVITGRRNNPKIKSAIAQALDTTVDQLFAKEAA